MTDDTIFNLKEKSQRIFLLILIGYAFLTFILAFNFQVSEAYLFDISMSENLQYVLIVGMRVLYSILMILFIVFALYQSSRKGSEAKRNALYLSISFAIFTFPMFSELETLGTLDMYMFMVTIVGVVLLIFGKADFLMPLVLGYGLLISTSFLLKGAPVLVAIMLYKWFNSTDRDRPMNKASAIISIVSLCLIFAVIEGYYHYYGLDYMSAFYPEMDGSFTSKWIILLPFLVFAPYIVIFILYMKRLAGKYLFLLCGLVPYLINAVLKENLGLTWFYCLTYLVIIFLALLALGDEKVMNAYSFMIIRLKELHPLLPVLLLIYPALFMPFSYYMPVTLSFFNRTS